MRCSDAVSLLGGAEAPPLLTGGGERAVDHPHQITIITGPHLPHQRDNTGKLMLAIGRGEDVVRGKGRGKRELVRGKGNGEVVRGRGKGRW